MKFHIKATDASGARVVKYVEAATGCDAVTAAICEGLSGVVAKPIIDPYAGHYNTRAADAHAVRLEMQHTPNWGAGVNSCRSCAYLDVQPRADGKIVPHHSRVYPCTAPVPAMPALPRSITMRHNFQWPPAKASMWANAGWDCPTYKKRVKAAAIAKAEAA